MPYFTIQCTFLVSTKLCLFTSRRPLFVKFKVRTCWWTCNEARYTTTIAIMFILARYFQNRRYYAILSTAPCYHGSSDYITDLIKAATHFEALAPTLLSYSPKIQFGYPFDSRWTFFSFKEASDFLFSIIRQFKFLIFRTTMKCLQNYFLCFFKRLCINIIFKSVFYFLFCSLFLCIIEN